MDPNMEFIGTLQKSRVWEVKVNPTPGGSALRADGGYSGLT